MSSFSLKNKSGKTISLFAEPEGFRKELQPEQVASIEVTGETGESVEITIEDGGDISIWPTGGDYKIIVDGVDFRHSMYNAPLRPGMNRGDSNS